MVREVVIRAIVVIVIFALAIIVIVIIVIAIAARGVIFMGIIILINARSNKSGADSRHDSFKADYIS